MKWTRAATKHRVSRDRSGYVIEHCGMRFERKAPPDSPEKVSPRLLFFGDDEEGVPLEVMAVELEDDDLLVIHAMPLRERYRKQYEEAKRWRK